MYPINSVRDVVSILVEWLIQIWSSWSKSTPYPSHGGLLFITLPGDTLSWMFTVWRMGWRMRDMGGHEVDLFWTIVCIIYLYCHLPQSLVKIYEVSNNLSAENFERKICTLLLLVIPRFLTYNPPMQWCHKVDQDWDGDCKSWDWDQVSNEICWDVKRWKQ